ncbi:NAD-dependent epimerase/dehydratase family protein [Flavobacterium bizetiae]|uniref:NAD-dependent epimerase/dehydratase family protein n=1 Tax=Flavobacterium bizetiae TaxID=2704140 RepID=UPI0021E8B98F|nr:NAD-dependent epimerase/dehydratase family protein [Flavobacterium bizetiae]UTN04626.1 NAD-dependent epimerase/dehydratase family protein [Flavobacterium bizetiae]
MKEIIITGATGFVGTNLQKYLNGLSEVQTLSLRYVPDQIFSFSGNVLIHLAGKAHDLKKVSKPNEYYETNFELTRQVFDSFLASDLDLFIFISTVKAVSDGAIGILTENEIANPKTHYGISKHLAEEYILSKKLPSNKRVYILRPCIIHGPGNKGNLNLLFQIVTKGLPWPLGSFYNQRSFLSIENFCFVINELIENVSIPSGVYNVADDKTLSTNELVQLLAISMNKRSKVLKVPQNLIWLIAKFGDYLYLPLNSERLQKLTENYVVSNEKIVKAIGKSLPISVDEGLRKTFISFRKK